MAYGSSDKFTLILGSSRGVFDIDIPTYFKLDDMEKIRLAIEKFKVNLVFKNFVIRFVCRDAKLAVSIGLCYYFTYSVSRL